MLLDEREFDELKAAAAGEGVTVAEWVREAIRSARRRRSEGDVEGKLTAIRTAMQYTFPAPDIEQMNAEIAMGYGSSPE